ncbi:23S rRNA (adenine(2503)-C(2))-methyltransferase RlmN [Polymorphobacter fuscus]|uniref:Dual-specificity RNA methyltransferase RlmN n=1 Tax=Sandarakinorhabdus fusca TaxID=1439888 RepID=A0A7C9GQN9_9SPHN|nr:23S rRNA (adenine(2503)-C(2))-methyltransferase RlmN [Polymorphobacter fuscus]KAB7645433.1 23S rRNA (adenine(2503)-C(2))-methyltransferase RlmN [Polymorphobacter fuscus]MQT17853.1 radical SAM protein [Polymorphobacter fuscus]NJC08482.1 23S rRNA (adenine2503-C2)-methyltransferase [Polymorphobacter fuscus]
MQIPGQFDPHTVPRRQAPPRPDGKRVLLGLSRPKLREALIGVGIPEKQANMRVSQVWNWIYQRGATQVSAFANISKDTRALLDQHFVVGRPEIVTAQVSVDGTRKWLLRFDDGEEAECVFIPDAYRGTLCVSSQVGCTLNCRFCFTGTMRLVRNLTPAEIVGQVMLARDALGEWPNGTASLPALPDTDDDDDERPWIPGHNQPGSNYTSEGRMLTNIVMMGMGEPLCNFDNVRDALAIVMDGDGLGLSKRRITLSTSGVVPMMARAGTEIGVNLAVSLHAVTKEIRDEIVPINKRYGIEELLTACAAYPGANNARRITFEYIMLKDKNDRDEDAHELVRLIRKYRLPAKVNLIPFNPWPGSIYETSTPERVAAFSDIIFAAGISAPIRRPRGRDIMAACGQLKSASEIVSRAELARRAAAKEAEWV